jgi:Fic family protein
MEMFIQFCYESKNCGIHPIMIACRIHSAFGHIHPFFDGNGRVGRSIMALYLICNGYLPAIFQKNQKEKYINSLCKIQGEKDATSLYDMVISDILSSYSKSY